MDADRPFEGRRAHERIVLPTIRRPHRDPVVQGAQTHRHERPEPDVEPAAGLEAGAGAVDAEMLAAEDIKRLSRRPTTVDEGRFDWLDDGATERPEWIAAFLEMKTVWHPIGV